VRPRLAAFMRDVDWVLPRSAQAPSRAARGSSDARRPALADLRAGIDEKRKLAAVVGGVVVAGVAAAAAVTAVRRLKGE
jgi:hypothetical protein